MPKKKAEKAKKNVKIKKIKPQKKQGSLENGLKKLSIKLFGRLADKYSDHFINVKQALITSDMKILFRLLGIYARIVDDIIPPVLEGL